jgi:hypothetical protein
VGKSLLHDPVWQPFDPEAMVGTAANSVTLTITKSSGAMPLNIATTATAVAIQLAAPFTRPMAWRSRSPARAARLYFDHSPSRTAICGRGVSHEYVHANR